MAQNIPGTNTTGPGRITGPASRSGRHARPAHGTVTFDEALRSLAQARLDYETIRSAGTATIADRFEARSKLDGFRLQVARLRHQLV